MQQRLCTRAVPLLASACLLLAAGPPPAQVVPLAEVEPGLKGSGWSVFAGREPERFEVEVLGVWSNVAPDTSYILSRLSGHGLEDSGVIAGMSGSPVYVGDRLLGAVAFSWPFATEPVAGITPIESMRAMTSSPGVPVTSASDAALTLSDLLHPQPTTERLVDRLSRLSPAPGGRAGGLLWSTVGFGKASRELLGDAVGEVVAGGRSERTPTDLRPGDAVAAVLIDGDLKLAATGTVTERLGDSVLAFGHPFLSMGDVEVPLASAEIITVVPSLANSFKIANVGEAIGRFDRDRAAGSRGSLGLRASVLPLEVEVNSGEPRRFEMTLARVPPLEGTLVATAVLGAIDAASGAHGAQRLDLRAEIALADRPPLTISQTFDGPSASVDVALHLLNVVGFLTGNTLSEVEIESIAVELEQSHDRDATRIVAAHPSRRVVRPGASLDLIVELDPYRGEARRHRVALNLPRDLRVGRYMLLVGDGASIDAARFDLEKFAPANLSQALGFLNRLHSRSELAVLGVEAAPGLAARGRALPMLPGSIREIWSGASGSGSTGLRAAVRQVKAENLGVPLDGLVRVDLDVEAGGGR